MINLKLLMGVIPERYSFVPVIRPQILSFGNDFHFAEYIYIEASRIKGLKKLVYRAKHRRLYCSYYNLKSNNYFEQKIAEEHIIETIRKTIKGVAE